MFWSGQADSSNLAEFFTKFPKYDCPLWGSRYWRVNIFSYGKQLKVQSWVLNNNKYMIALIRIINTGIFAFIAVLVSKLLSRKVLFINRKDNRNCKKVGYVLRK